MPPSLRTRHPLLRQPLHRLPIQLRRTMLPLRRTMPPRPSDRGSSSLSKVRPSSRGRVVPEGRGLVRDFVLEVREVPAARAAVLMEPREVPVPPLWATG